MSWNTISTNDILNEMSPQETAVINGIQGANGGLGAILTKVVVKCRSQIKAGGNQLDMSGATIPDGVIEEVIAIARWRWINSVPGMASLKSKERKEAYDNAVAMFEKISSNDPNRPRVELPPVPDETAAPVSGVEVAGKSRRKFTRHKMEGL